MPSNKLGIQYGLVTGLLMVIYNFVLQFLKVAPDSLLYYVVVAIFFGGVLAFCFAFSKKEENDISFRGMFKGGFRMIAILTLVLLAATLITAFLDPSIRQESMNANRAAFVAQGKTPADVEIAMKNASDNFTLMLVMGVVFTNIFYGVVFTVIGAAIFRKNKV